MEQVTDLVREFAGKLSDLASQYAQPAWELALVTARVGALNELMPAIVSLFASIVAAYVSLFAYKKCDNIDYTLRELFVTVSILSGFLSALLCVLFFLTIGNVYAWVGLFYPEVWLAYKLLGL